MFLTEANNKWLNIWVKRLDEDSHRACMTSIRFEEALMKMYDLGYNITYEKQWKQAYWDKKHDVYKEYYG